ncbi:MAG TPA: DUF6152 family protein [Gammaproteobacteria bacterium]|nr:DUF6152 family protein [Gammaproteobacteria bacterium]
MGRSTLLLILIAAAAALMSPAFSHHSRAGFAESSVEVYLGTVTRLTWANPHVYITLELADGSGEWRIETDAIPILLRSGWRPDSLQPGDRLLVRGNPGVDPRERHALLVSVQKDDGTVLLPRSQFEQSSARAITRTGNRDLSGVWELPFGEAGSFMERWGSIALTEKGIEGREAFRPSDRPAAQCIGTPTPMLLAMPYLNEIELGEEVVYIRSEFLNAERTIYMDGRGHPENGERTVQGHSIGRWEDDNVLVVDTTLFADHRAPIRGSNEGVPSGASRHVVERFSLSADGTRIQIDFTVEDPEFLAEPFTGSLEWVYVPDFELSGLECTP